MLFAIMNIDKPDSLALRAATRETHLGYLDSIVGQMLLAGPVLNAEGQSIGSLLIVEAENQAAAEAFAAADPYAKAWPVRERDHPALQARLQRRRARGLRQLR